MTIECRHLLKSYSALQHDIKSKLFEEVLASVSQSTSADQQQRMMEKDFCACQCHCQ